MVNEEAIKQVREVSDALQMIGEAFGKLTIPEDSKFLAHKLVTMFQAQIPANETNCNSDEV